MIVAKIYPESKSTGGRGKTAVSNNGLDRGALSKARLVLKVLPELAQSVKSLHR